MLSTREAETLAAAHAHGSWTYWIGDIQRETELYFGGTLASEDGGDSDTDQDMPDLQLPDDPDTDDDMPDLELSVAPAA